MLKKDTTKLGALIIVPEVAEANDSSVIRRNDEYVSVVDQPVKFGVCAGPDELPLNRAAMKSTHRG